VTKFNWARANPLGSLAFLQAHGELLGLATVRLPVPARHTVLPSIFVLYAGFRYHWGSDMVGLTMMLTGILGVVVQTFFVGPVVSRIGERGALLLGTLGGRRGSRSMVSRPNGWAYIASAPVFAVMSFLQPGLQGLMTRRVGPAGTGAAAGGQSEPAGHRLGHRPHGLRPDLRLGGAQRRGAARARPCRSSSPPACSRAPSCWRCAWGMRPLRSPPPPRNSLAIKAPENPGELVCET